MNGTYGHYGGAFSAPLHGTWGVTTTELAAYVSTEIGKATVGTALQSLDQANVPDVMRDPPVNSPGAYYRNAYWLAIASRLANTRGNKSGSTALLSSAVMNRAKAALPTGTALGFNENPDSIAAILVDGARVAAKYKINEVTIELQRLASPTLIRRQQEELGTGPASGILPGSQIDPLNMAKLVPTVDLSQLDPRNYIPKVPELPSWVLPVVGATFVALLGGGVYYMAKKSRRRRR